MTTEPKQPSIYDLTFEQRSALLHFKVEHGKTWRKALLAGWSYGWGRNEPFMAYALQQVRNQFGPSWLKKVKDA